jgi:hypothetical protein
MGSPSGAVGFIYRPRSRDDLRTVLQAALLYQSFPLRLLFTSFSLFLSIDS